ncbi:CPBP family intramembrane metalloprotease, partial [bacterium]|nr:CPBP family intramembrane metalloprotease [bacterium]
QIWSPKNASSYEVLGRTIGGYLIVGIQLALVIATYLFATAFLGWWSPSDILISPNILATYLPWLSPFSAALSAGFIEECLFRAIPLAGAALLGKKYGHTTLWITIAFILQALIFGGAHATYATQPSYARLIELIIPSFLFGGMYLLYGLLPAILSHTIFDLTLMSLPLFISSGTEGKINQIIVIFLALIPFIIIFIARLKTKLFKSLNINSYNAAWKPPVLIKKNIPKKTEPIFTKKISAKTKKITIIVGLFSLFIWGLLTTFQQESPKLLISKSKAISLAQKELEKRNITLDKTWQTLPMLIGNYTTHPIHTMQHQFIWQSDKSLYRSLIGSYLAPSRWVIRFVTFSGTISERSEEYLVIITEHGTVFRFIHKIPELKSGKHLNEKKAREIAHNYLAQSIKIQPNQVQEISATKTKKPNRTDWLFTFFNPTVYTLQEGKAQIKIQISGNEITDSNYDIHVPEIWQRENRKKQNMMGIIKILSMIFLFGLFLIALFKRKRYTFSIPTAIISFVVYSFILTFSFFNTWTTIIANINTSEPFGQQLFFILAALSIGMIIQVGILALFSGFTYSYKSTKLTIKKFKIFIVGLCLGTTVIALNSLWQAFFPPIKPLWATFELLATRLPLIASINNAILGIITYTTINLILLGALDFISNRFKNNKTILIPLFLIIGIAFNGIFDFAGIGQWLLSGSILGIILFIIYYFIIRFDHSIIVSILGAIFALKYIQQALFDAYPLAWLGNIFAAITVILVALFLFLRVTSKKNFIK